ncbi:uncharacterized protein LOC112566917 [Pomacea canaliculata]|uniref:uncharacterized protein LOC112566917 n=1 Tax=Pomacea canaliculata TaxID=400727 RepID=UPI000D727AAA|nr:uncharacterized protein LOC112566917 [Pomacea canaliculata]
MASNNSADVLNKSLGSVAGVVSGGDGKAADTSLLIATHLLVIVIIGGIGTVAVSLFGVLSNVVNCLVFYHQGLRDRMNLCLFCLALADFCFLMCSAMYGIVIVFIVFRLRGFGEEENMKFVNYGVGIVHAFRTTSGLYVMVIAVERCVCVAFPFRASSLIRTRTMAMFLSAIALICQLGFICQPLKFNVVETKIGGVRQWRFAPSPLWLNNRVVIDIIVHVIFNISVPLITFFIVSLATFITVIKLASAMDWRRKTSSTSTDQNERQVALTKTLVLASCVYIVSTTPTVLTKVVRVFVEEFSAFGVYAHLDGICNVIADIFSAINSSVYIFIYYKRSARYRQKLRAVHICRR